MLTKSVGLKIINRRRLVLINWFSGEIREGRASQAKSTVDDGCCFGRKNYETVVRGGTIAKNIKPREARAYGTAKRFKREYYTTAIRYFVLLPNYCIFYKMFL